LSENYSDYNKRTGLIQQNISFMNLVKADHAIRLLEKEPVV